MLLCNGGHQAEGAGGQGRGPAGSTGVAQPLAGVCCVREEMRSNLVPWSVFKIDQMKNDGRQTRWGWRGRKNLL